MKITILDSLDALGEPELELPLDDGGGPFASPAPDPNSEIIMPAPGDSSLSQSDIPEIDQRVESGRRIVSAGLIVVSDIIPANSFRRVQHDVNIPFGVADDIAHELGHAILVNFQGSASAVLQEKTDASQGRGPPTNAIQALQSAIEAANQAAENESTSPDGSIDLRAPLPPSKSFYFIQFRQPALEFAIGQPGVDYFPDRATGIRNENELHEFRFNVDTRRQFELRYPMGRRIPILFDIINRHDRAISADLYVEFLIVP